jgi:hypothetical protein
MWIAALTDCQEICCRKGQSSWLELACTHFVCIRVVELGIDERSFVSRNIRKGLMMSILLAQYVNKTEWEAGVTPGQIAQERRRLLGSARGGRTSPGSGSLLSAVRVRLGRSADLAKSAVSAVQVRSSKFGEPQEQCC